MLASVVCGSIATRAVEDHHGVALKLSTHRLKAPSTYASRRSASPERSRRKILSISGMKGTPSNVPSASSVAKISREVLTLTSSPALKPRTLDRLLHTPRMPGDYNRALVVVRTCETLHLEAGEAWYSPEIRGAWKAAEQAWVAEGQLLASSDVRYRCTEFGRSAEPSKLTRRAVCGDTRRIHHRAPSLSIWA